MLKLLKNFLLFALVVSLANCKDKSPAGFDTVLEIVVTGDATPTIMFPNPGNGNPDQFIHAVLPKNIIYANNTANAVVIKAAKNEIRGNYKIVARFNDKVIGEASTSAPFGQIEFTFDRIAQKATGVVTEPDEWPCGISKGNQVYTGKAGGCYYLDAAKNKISVDRAECQCN